MLKTIFLILGLVFGPVVCAQDVSILDLKKEIDASDQEEEKIQLLEKLLDLNMETEIDSIDLYLKQYHDFSLESENPIHLLRSYRYELHKLKQTVSYDSLLHLVGKGLDFLEDNRSAIKAEEYLQLELDFLFYRASTQGILENYKHSLADHYQLIEMIDQAEGQLDDDLLAKYRFNNWYALSRNYLFNQDSLANVYADKAIDVARAINDHRLLYKGFNLKYYAGYWAADPNILNNIADSCLHYANAVKEAMLLAESFMHKCNALLELDSIEEGSQYCEQAINQIDSIDDPSEVMHIYNNIGNVFEKVGQLERSLAYYEKSHEIAVKGEDPASYLTSLQNLGEKNYFLKNYAEASKYYFLYSDSLKSHYERIIQSQFAEAEAKYQSSEKQKQIVLRDLKIEQQKNQRNRLIAVSISALALLGMIFLWFVFRQKEKKRIADEILAQKEKEAARLKELDDLKSRFFTDVSHELRTPLTLITGPLENVIEKIDKAQIRKDLALAHSNSKKLLDLVDEILALSKMESGQVKLENSSFELDATTKRMFYAFQSFANLHKIKLQYKSHIPPNVFCFADVEKYEKVLNNLISNAIKYSPEKTIVQLHLRRQQEDIIIEVEDEGIGISPEERVQIFDRFYQAKNLHRRSSGGTGVGLALAKEYAELMGGNLKYEARENIGSRFTFHLPFQPAIGKESVAGVVRNEKRPSPVFKPTIVTGKMEHILIVEDNPEMANYISSILSDFYHCTLAKNGHEAIQMIQKQPFDLISSDIMMPKMDGFQLKTHINKMRGIDQIPFIFLSARNVEDDKVRGLQLGVEDYITKPFNKYEYLARVQNLIKNKKVREEWIRENNDASIEADPSDQKLLKEAEKLVLTNMSNPDFKIADLAKGLNYSQRQLTRIIKKLTGMTPVGFILELRLQRAYYLIKKNIYSTVAEVRDAVGIESASYFTRKMKERFGLNPSDIK